jgi:hypothetical protein
MFRTAQALSTIVGTLLLTFAWHACTSQTQAPERPPNVPASALWAGGPDGGVFFVIQKRGGKSGAYDASIYHDRSGDLLYSGPLTLGGSPGPEPDLSKPELFQGWDGERLLLTDGRFFERPHRSR